jgi:hypothetical protein
MPLNQATIDAINSILNGDAGLNYQVNKIIEAREDCNALIRINADIPDATCGLILLHAKQKALVAAQALVTLLQ